MDEISSNDLLILKEKARTYRGSFKVPLDQISLEGTPHDTRQRDPKNVTRLLESFALEGCNKLQPENYISVLVNGADLPSQNILPNTYFEEPPAFASKSSVVCLDGHHRIQAAREYLAGEDRWWVAHVYSDDINSSCKTALREKDSGSADYFGGDVYRHIRISALNDDNPRKRKWLAKLSPGKRHYVARFEKSNIMSEVRAGLDALIPFTGLWPDFKLGTLQRILKIHCPEEMTNALRQICLTWTFILGESQAHQNVLDANTVHILQGRCPFCSFSDRSYLEAEMQKNNILPGASPALRTEMYQRILAVQHSIPTIYTFLENTKILEPCAKILQGLLPAGCKSSLAQSFRALHNGQTRFKEQVSTFSYKYRELSTGAEVEWCSYRQLWILLLRHFPSPRKDTGKWKARAKCTGKRKCKLNERLDQVQTVIPHEFGEQWIRELAMLASANGYRQIRKADGEIKSADAVMAEDFLMRIRPSKYYDMGAGLLDQKVDAICQMLHDIEESKIRSTNPEITSDFDDCGSDIDDRCGRPQEHSVKKDEQNLFLAFIYATNPVMIPKQYMTSFAWKRDMFQAFFGQPQAQLMIKRNTPTEIQPVESPSTVNTALGKGAQGQRLDPAPTVVWERGTDTSSTPKSATRISREVSIRLPPDESPAGPVPPEGTVNREGRTDQSRESDSTISIAEARRLLFGNGASDERNSFVVLFPAKKDRFHMRCVQSVDRVAMVAALNLSSTSHYLVAEEGGRLKLMDPKTIVEQAAVQQIKVILMTPQRESEDIINRLEI